MTRVKFKYSEEQMERALRAVELGMPKKTAAKRFGVPRSTIADKIFGRTPRGRKIGANPVLKKKEEEKIVE